VECRAMVEPQASSRGIGMTFPEFSIPRFISADRTRVKQVLINLLTNAIKYNTKDGLVEVKYAIRVPGRVRVTIRDTGAGLLPSQIALLFQSFNRLGQEGSNIEGSGIGLVLAKRLVELMHGVIGVESVVGTGSVFWFELAAVAEPCLAVDNTEATPPPVGTGLAPRSERPYSLLYVEDNPANLRLVEQIMARHPGVRLLTAVTGSTGIEIAVKMQPDVVLMDINLPDISGFEALRILRSDAVTARLPVIALSANAMPRDIDKGMQAGFFRYLTKPIKVQEIMDALREALASVVRSKKD